MLGLGKGSWMDIEIEELRGGNLIREVKDKVQRKINKDGSHEYYLKKAKVFFEAQEYEMIYVNADGSQALKVFSPAKGVYFPITLKFKKIRELTDKEQEQIDIIKITPEEQQKLDSTKKKKDKEIFQEQINQRIEKEKNKLKNKIYREIYDAEFEVEIDTETLNHYIYKVQKNVLRLTAGAGLSPQMLLTITIIFMAVGYMMMMWANYNYNYKPTMDFWTANSPQVIELAKTLANKGCPSPSSNQILTPVNP